MRWNETPPLLVRCATLVVSLAVANPSWADTVWKSSGSGQETLCARDVVIIEQGPTSVQYRELRGSVVLYGRCDANEKQGESLRVIASSQEERRAILARWMKLGHSAEVTDISGKAFTVFNLGLDFDAPPGVMLFCGFGGGCPEATSQFRLRHGESTSTVQFAEVESITVSGEILTARLKGGAEISGSLVGERAGNTALIPKFKGWEDLGASMPVDFSLEVRQVKTVVFK